MNTKLNIELSEQVYKIILKSKVQFRRMFNWALEVFSNDIMIKTLLSNNINNIIFFKMTGTGHPTT